MATIFARSCVLLGDLDSFCMGCSLYIPANEDVIEHIQKSRHTVKRPVYDYVEKYKDDCIKKYPGVYFCEICNIVINTAARVSMHVTTELHLERKRRQLKRVGTSIVFQNKYLISNEAWDSLVEDTCLVCDAEYDDFMLHTCDINHLMNVVRSKVIVDGENIYRKVGGGYQCLTCNYACSDNKIIEHLNSTLHKDSFIIYDENQKSDDVTGLIATTDAEIPIESEEYSRRDRAYEGEDELSTGKDDDDEDTDEAENEDGENKEGNTEGNEGGNKEGNEERNNEEDEVNQETNEDNKDKDEDNKDNKDENNDEKKEKDEDENKEDDEENKEKDKENKENNEACGGVIEEMTKYDSDMEIEPPLEPVPSCSRTEDTILYARLTQPQEEPPPPRKIAKEVEIFAQQNNLYLNRCNATVYCNPCSQLMTATMRCIKEHVASKRHKENIKPRYRPMSPTEFIAKYRKKVEKVKMQGFVKSLYEFNTPNGNFVLVNEQFCLTADDYMGYTTQNAKTICQLCELELTKDNVELHKESHLQVMRTLFLITSLDTEFIRQIRVDLYHCGFCGKTNTTFDEMLEHLRSPNHVRHKAIYLKLLKRFVATNPDHRTPVLDIMQLAKKF